jgi:hypothetical protein
LRKSRALVREGSRRPCKRSFAGLQAGRRLFGCGRRDVGADAPMYPLVAHAAVTVVTESKGGSPNNEAGGSTRVPSKVRVGRPSSRGRKRP